MHLLCVFLTILFLHDTFGRNTETESVQKHLTLNNRNSLEYLRKRFLEYILREGRRKNGPETTTSSVKENKTPVVNDIIDESVVNEIRDDNFRMREKCKQDLQLCKNSQRSEEDLAMIDTENGKIYKETQVDTKVLEEDLTDFHPKPPKKLYKALNGRGFLHGDGFRWKNGVIPYLLKETLSSNCRQTILKAIDIFHNNTCIKWQLYNKSAGQKEHVEFISGDKSWAFVGYVQNLSAQPISIKESHCDSLHVVLHEMAHTVGMTHEQSRSDRNEYVVIHWENVVGGKDNANLQEGDVNSYNNPYDYSSVTHYSLFAFSKNGKKTITFKYPDYEFYGLEESSLSFYDIKDILSAYQCAKHCPRDLKCENGGFLGPACICRCPPDISGTKCERINSECANTINIPGGTEEVIFSPKLTKHYDCVWLIKAPQGMRINISTITFNLPGHHKPPRCDQYVEIRFNLIGQRGPEYCGDELSKPFFVTPRGEESHLMLLKFQNKKKEIKPGTGFSFKIKSFEDIDENAVNKIHINYCERDQSWCSNGGTCVFDDESGVRCECPEGYHGASCDEQPIDGAHDVIPVQAESDSSGYDCKIGEHSCDINKISSGDQSWIQDVPLHSLIVKPSHGGQGEEAAFALPQCFGNGNNGHLTIKFSLSRLSESCSDFIQVDVEHRSSALMLDYTVPKFHKDCHELTSKSSQFTVQELSVFETICVSFKSVLAEEGYFGIAIENISVSWSD